MASCIFIFEIQLIYVGAYVQDERHFNLLLFSLFFSIKLVFGIFHVVKDVKYVQS